MQKVDIAIVALGAVALIATGLGIGLYDDGELDFSTTISDETTFSQASEPVPSGGLEWSFDVPNNTFHAGGAIDVAWTTQDPTLSGPVDVTVTVTGPDGTVDTLTGNFQLADGSGSIPFTVSSWADPPESFRGTHDEADAMSISWDSPLEVEIVIQGPAGQAPIPGVDVDDVAYTASFDGYWHTFAVTPATPELETV